MYLRHYIALSKINSIPKFNCSFFSTRVETEINKTEKSGKKSTYQELEYVKPPHYVNTYPSYEPKHMLQEEFMPEANKTGLGPRLADYLSMKKMVESLESVQEKIDFVNPYEREWTKVEKTWHRKWHPTLFSTRKAWGLPTIPKYFDCLSYYQYITKMRLVNNTRVFNEFFKNFVLPTETFKNKVTESLITYLFNESSDPDMIRTDKFLRTLFYDAQTCLSHNRQELKDLRVSQTGRVESFWIRGGFSHLYEDKKIWLNTATFNRRAMPKFIGDDRRKLGELAFTMRDEFALQLRQKEPMKEIFSLNDIDNVESPLFNENIDKRDICYSPKIFNLWPDADPLWQCPGYEYDCGETHKYGRVGFKNTLKLNDRFNHWNIRFDEYDVRKDMYNSIAVSSLFNWLNAQAHCDGYTQYTDVEKPFVSNLILSDGVEFAFATGQLNTIAINIDNPDFVNEKTNVCYVDGPYKLYEEYDPETQTFYHKNVDGNNQEGLNELILLRILQLIIKN